MTCVGRPSGHLDQDKLLLCSELTITKCQKNRSLISVKIQKYQIRDILVIMIKLDFFFHMILKYIDLAMSFKNITLNTARLARYFVKLVAQPISVCIMLKLSNFISQLVNECSSGGQSTAGLTMLTTYIRTQIFVMC